MTSLRRNDRNPRETPISPSDTRTTPPTVTHDGSPEARATARFAIRWFEEIWNQGRTQAIRELWGDGGVGHIEGQPDVAVDDFIQFHRHLNRGLSALKVELLDVTAAGVSVVVHWRLTGRHTGTLFGIPATGHFIDEPGMTRFVLRDGRMHEGWDTWNLGALLDRLARPDADSVAHRCGLTRRQAEVAILMADRLSAKAIARTLDIAVNTARRHCQAVMRRLGLHSRDAVAEAIGRSEVTPSAPSLDP